LGPRFGTLIWDLDLGPRFGTPIWDPAPVWDLIWDLCFGPDRLDSAINTTITVSPITITISSITMYPARAR
jgi:hypothetical protein